jgi:hypothetical protein
LYTTILAVKKNSKFFLFIILPGDAGISNALSCGNSLFFLCYFI